jgi:hypothetical protein
MLLVLLLLPGLYVMLLVLLMLPGVYVMLDVTPNHMGYVKEVTATDATSYRDAAAFKELHPFNLPKHFHNCTRCSPTNCGVKGVPTMANSAIKKGTSSSFLDPFYGQLQQAITESNNTISIDGFTSTHCRLMNLPVSNRS